MKNKTSAVGDLSPLMKDLEAVFFKHFKGRAALAVAFTLPPDYSTAHWATNISRDEGIEIFEQTAARMRSQLN